MGHLDLNRPRHTAIGRCASCWLADTHWLLGTRVDLFHQNPMTGRTGVLLRKKKQRNRCRGDNNNATETSKLFWLLQLFFSQILSYLSSGLRIGSRRRKHSQRCTHLDIWPLRIKWSLLFPKNNSIGKDTFWRHLTGSACLCQEMSFHVHYSGETLIIFDYTATSQVNVSEFKKHAYVCVCVFLYSH